MAYFDTHTNLEHRLATKSDISELRIDISSMHTNIK